MKKSILIGFSAIIFGIFTSLLFVNATEEKKPSFIEDELIIKFKKNNINLSSTEGTVSTLNFAQTVGMSQTDINTEFNFSVWKNKNENYSLEELITALEKSSLIESVQKNYIYYPNVTPNDTNFNNLWSQTNTGQSVNSTSGTSDSDIDATEAWDIRTDASSVIVAVTDTGILTTHPDLTGNLWTNTGETSGNGIDDDGNGYIDDIYGYDFPNNTGNISDFNGHGTHVAGTIGAKGNNGIGVSGVSWDVKLMPLVIFEPDSVTGDPIASTSDILKAFTYAKNNGANIINASWGGYSFDSLIKESIEAMPGVLFIVAAGNETNNNEITPIYPANYNLPNIISIAATDQDDDIASFSNYGTTTVDLAAPGVNIYSTTKDGNYGYMNGTSMATPLVSGMAALILAEKPNLTPSQVKSLLISYSDSISNLNGKVVANGRVNLFKVLDVLQTTVSGTATIERTDSYTPKTSAGETPDVLQFALTNNYADEVFVETIDLFGEMDQSEEIDISLSGSGFSFTGNSGTLLGSGSGNVLELTTLGTGTGFSLLPSETKYITAAAEIPNDTALSEFQLNVSDIKLTSGSGFSLLFGSGLSLSNPLSGSNFKLLPTTFTLEQQFPLNDQDIIATNTNITGKIGGNFDLDGFTLNAVITQNGVTFPASNYTTTFNNVTRAFKITNNGNFNLNQTININLTLTEGGFILTGPSFSFQTNTVPKTTTYFDSEKEINEDFIIPIDFDNQNFTFNNKLTLVPETIIAGINEGLKIEFTAGTLISKASSSITWGGEIKAPTILSVPNANLFESASGKASNISFAPKKRFEVGSANVSLSFDQNVVFTIPTSETGSQGIYYSQDGINWTRHGVCQITDAGFCIFQSNHFTQFVLGTETTTASTTSGSTSRQNHMRHGGYDPRKIEKQFKPQRYDPNQIIYKERSDRKRKKYIPCEIPEGSDLTNSLYNLKLSQGAPSMCREDFGKFKELPYTTYKK